MEELVLEIPVLEFGSTIVSIPLVKDLSKLLVWKTIVRRNMVSSFSKDRQVDLSLSPLPGISFYPNLGDFPQYVMINMLLFYLQQII